MKKIQTTSFSLHIMAMFLMLCDHIWGTGVIRITAFPDAAIPGRDWLTCIGRIAFPIFAFMIVEGFYETRNRWKYILRMLIWAVIAEIPFDLMYEGIAFNPYHQNVLWTFLISMLIMMLLEKIKEISNKYLKWIVYVIAAILLAAIGFLIGMLTMVDYYGFGVLTVLAFYVFRGRKWYNYPLQLIALYYINCEMLGGMYYEINIFGHTFDFVQQGLALLAFIPIWLYRGKQGPYNKVIKYIYYGFYPAHCFILFLLANLLG